METRWYFPDPTICCIPVVRPGSHVYSISRTLMTHGGQLTWLSVMKRRSRYVSLMSYVYGVLIFLRPGISFNPQGTTTLGDYHIAPYAFANKEGHN